MNTHLANNKSLNNYPTQILIESTIEQPNEALVFATTTSAVTTNIKSQSAMEELIDYQAMIII